MVAKKSCDVKLTSQDLLSAIFVSSVFFRLLLDLIQALEPLIRLPA